MPADPAELDHGRSTAVAIGVSGYQDPDYQDPGLGRLASAANSLALMRRLLADPALCGWPPERIVPIPDPSSPGELAVQLRDIARRTEGTLLLYYVGHGELTATGELILTVTTTLAKYPKETGLRFDLVRDAFNDSPARVKVAILDCCGSGIILPTVLGPATLAHRAHVEGAHILTAATGNNDAHRPPADAGPGAATSFTAAVADVLRRGLPGKPGWLTLADLFPTLAARLREQGLPEPGQAISATAAQAPFTRNAATFLNAAPLSYEELLRMADNWPNQIPTENRTWRFPIGIAESSSAPVYLDLNRCLHCIVIGDAESGKTSLIRSIVHSICASNTEDQAKIILVDYRCTLLNEIPDEYHGGWATTVNTATELMEALRDSLRERMPGPEVSMEQRVNRSWWSGPDVCVIIDDYDMVAASTSNPIDALLEFLPHARHLGLHVIIARRAGGAGRAMLEPVLARTRDLGSAGFIMSCERDEGVLIGTTKPSKLSPGQGTIITAESEELIRISWLPPASGSTPRAIARSTR